MRTWSKKCDGPQICVCEPEICPKVIRTDYVNKGNTKCQTGKIDKSQESLLEYEQNADLRGKIRRFLCDTETAVQL